MGIVYDPELYRASEKDFAPYPLTDEFHPGNFQTWHTDAVYDNGYLSTVMFTTTGPVIAVATQVIDPEGNPAVESMQFFEPEEYKYEKDGFDLNMGDNYYRGRFPTIEIFSKDEDGNSVNLTVETLVQPTLSELPYGVGIGRVKTPTMPISIAWYQLPWNKITGTLTIRGKEIPVSGYGWSDHQFGTADFFSRACQYYHWGLFPLGDHILAFFEAQGTKEEGFRPIKWLWDYKDGKLHAYYRDCDYYVYVEDIPEGDTAPRKMKVVFEDDRIRGVVDCAFKTLMQKQGLEADGRKIVLNRAAYDCRATMEIDGEPIDTSFVRILEAGYEPDRAPAPPAPAVERKPNEAEKPSRLSINSKLKAVLKDPGGHEILERHIPGISSSPQTKLGYGMTLKTIFGMPQAGVSKEKLMAIDEELRRLD
jgi:hypothetical protein